MEPAQSHAVAELPGTTVGAAIATTLSFSLEPTNWPSGAMTPVRTFAEQNDTWAYIILCMMGGVTGLYLFRRFVGIDIGVRRG